MKKRWMLPVIFITILSACEYPPKAGIEPANFDSLTDRAKDSVYIFLKQYYQVMSDRQWDQFKNFFWDYATITTAWQPPGDTIPKVTVVTIDQFIGQTKQGPDSKPVFEEKMTNTPDIRITRNIATVWAEYHAKLGTREVLTEWDGTDVFTLMRHEGQWKIVSLVYE